MKKEIDPRPEEGPDPSASSGNLPPNIRKSATSVCHQLLRRLPVARSKLSYNKTMRV
jgi:hypothetical protein